MTPPTLSPEAARRLLLGAAGLGSVHGVGESAVPGLLARLGCIQLDPIDRCGANADLVVAARVDGVHRGAAHRSTRGVAFEHFAKERCLIDARHWPAYRQRAGEPGWWRSAERLARVLEDTIAEVLAELRERGAAATPSELTDRGDVPPLDWHGWRGTGKVTALALEVLWTRCAVVASGRDARGRRVYDVPERALPEWADAPFDGHFEEVQLVERVRTAGLLARATGPAWSVLASARTDGTVDRLVRDGRLCAVSIGGRPYLRVPDVAEPPADDGRLRVLGPLDPLVWDRALVRFAFDFDYVWEVYKPAAKRIYGYYTCPMLHRGALVGRVEARRDGSCLVVERVDGAADPDALRDALERLAALNGCDMVVAAGDARRV